MDKVWLAGKCSLTLLYSSWQSRRHPTIRPCTVHWCTPAICPFYPQILRSFFRLNPENVIDRSSPEGEGTRDTSNLQSLPYISWHSVFHQLEMILWFKINQTLGKCFPRNPLWEYWKPFWCIIFWKSYDMFCSFLGDKSKLT